MNVMNGGSGFGLLSPKPAATSVLLRGGRFLRHEVRDDHLLACQSHPIVEGKKGVAQMKQDRAVGGDVDDADLGRNIVDRASHQPGLGAVGAMGEPEALVEGHDQWDPKIQELAPRQDLVHVVRVERAVVRRLASRHHIPLLLFIQIERNDFGPRAFHVECEEAARLAELEHPAAREVDVPQIGIGRFA